MTVREISLADVDFLDGVRAVDFEEGWNKNMLVSAFNGGRFFGYVLENDGERLSFITCSHGLDGITDVESVYTLPTFRKKGYAKILLEKVISVEKANGGAKIFLEVKKENLPAIELYRSFGFAKISERKKYYPDGSDAFVMVKEL